MKKKKNLKAWLYLLPAILFLGVFMLYPLVDVCIYSVEENFHFVSQKYSGVGLGNFRHVLTDPYFVNALKNTLILAVSSSLIARFNGIPVFLASALHTRQTSSSKGYMASILPPTMACIFSRERPISVIRASLPGSSSTTRMVSSGSCLAVCASKSILLKPMLSQK